MSRIKGTRGDKAAAIDIKGKIKELQLKQEIKIQRIQK